MKKVFISGPMTGAFDYNIPTFNLVAERLEAADFEVVNPATLFEGTDIPLTNWLECMRHTIKHLVDCDAIILLPGWEKSRGSVAEAALARNLGLKHIDYETLQVLPGSGLPVTLV